MSLVRELCDAAGCLLQLLPSVSVAARSSLPHQPQWWRVISRALLHACNVICGRPRSSAFSTPFSPLAAAHSGDEVESDDDGLAHASSATALSNDPSDYFGFVG